jgi:ubiquinone/menaquinone biosynthesis C-methylase UbiE
MNTFDSRAQSWDADSERVKMAKDVADAMITALSFGPDSVVMDYGAGTGNVSFEIAKHAGSVIAADSSEGMLRVLKEKISAAEVKNIKAVIFDAEKQRWSAPPFTHIVSSMTMHHITDIRSVFNSFHSMLKSGGAVAIADLASEDGTFHNDNKGVRHFGFEPGFLAEKLEEAGFKEAAVFLVYTAARNGKEYPVIMAKAVKP